MTSERADTDRIRVLFAGADSAMYARLAATASESPDLALLGPTDSPAETLEMVVSARPQVVVLDLAIGGTIVEGANLVAEIRTTAPETKILVCSAVTINGIVRYLLRLGISAYVFENIDPRALVLVIRTVASGGTVFSEAILR